MKPLFAHLPSLERRIRRADQVALFLDYDGTLAPIRERPEQAQLSADAKVLLKALCRRPGVWVAVISGRALADVRRMAGVRGLCYIGNHGLELQGPKLRHVNRHARSGRPVMKELAQRLRQALRSLPRAWVEDKGLTLAVHYRRVTPEDKILVRNAFHAVVRPCLEKGRVRVTSGKEVLEVRPPVRWTKGTMVRWLLARQRGLHPEERILPIYVGDDLTDEDAFLAMGGRGITVLVGSSNPLSRAQYRVASPAAVLRFLRRLLALRQAQGRLTGAGSLKPSACRR